MNKNLQIVVLTHNPKGNWGDVRPIIEKDNGYKNWKKSINLQIGQTVLLYISESSRKIQYIMEVEKVHVDSVDLKLICKLNIEKSNLLSLKKLQQNGFKNGTINYILDNNKQLYKYVIDVLDNETNKMNTKNIILYGAPGVGKTHNYQRLISMIENGENEKTIFDIIINNKSSEQVKLGSDLFQNIKDDKRVEFITFHQSYSYEDFIEGFRPNPHAEIELQDGIFKEIVRDALKQQEKNFYLVIDEINRGNISKIFGELITLIEEDKRDTYEVTLPYSKEKFKIPSNLYIIATMNSTDKSIATIDIALRRRFTFLKMLPNENLIKSPYAQILFNNLNDFIKENLSEDYMLGHSYFMKIENNEDLAFVKEYKIKPLLEEYFYADDVKLDEALKILSGVVND